MNKRKLIQFIQEQKTGPCEDCGLLFPYWSMQFDHIQGIKKFNISDVGRHIKVTVKQVKEEIAKCALVCSNCHHSRTYKTNNNSIEFYLEPLRPVPRENIGLGITLLCTFCTTEITNSSQEYFLEGIEGNIVVCSIECFAERTIKEK